MKKVGIIGGTGRIGQLLVKLLKQEEAELSLYVQSKEKAQRLGFGDISLIEGNVLDTDRLSKAIEEKDIVVAILSGDLLSYAKSIADALKRNPQAHIIWITGMGIHHEVPGEVGKLLDDLCRQMPEYVDAADIIADSGNPYTLIRAAHLTDGSNSKYYIQHEGEELHSNSVDRIAVARLIADLINGTVDMITSIGVTN